MKANCFHHMLLQTSTNLDWFDFNVWSVCGFLSLSSIYVAKQDWYCILWRGFPVPKTVFLSFLPHPLCLFSPSFVPGPITTSLFLLTPFLFIGWSMTSIGCFHVWSIQKVFLSTQSHRHKDCTRVHCHFADGWVRWWIPCYCDSSWVSKLSAFPDSDLRSTSNKSATKAVNASHAHKYLTKNRLFSSFF